jgi:thiosulfate/3-mercaptopyruvate sulfurtransferase
MKKLGIRLCDKVVCYDTGAMQFFGYRAVWMFHAMGHNNVCVLDGGFQKWKNEKLPIETSD